jgi:hypothetical protein
VTWIERNDKIASSPERGRKNAEGEINMRTRHSTGGVRKQRGRWIGLWYENGRKKSRVLGFIKDMTKGEAREAVAQIVMQA